MELQEGSSNPSFKIGPEKFEQIGNLGARELQKPVLNFILMETPYQQKESESSTEPGRKSLHMKYATLLNQYLTFSKLFI